MPTMTAHSLHSSATVASSCIPAARARSRVWKRPPFSDPINLTTLFSGTAGRAAPITPRCRKPIFCSTYVDMDMFNLLVLVQALGNEEYITSVANADEMAARPPVSKG